MDPVSGEWRARALAGARSAIAAIDDPWDRFWAMARLRRVLPPDEVEAAAVSILTATLTSFPVSERVTMLADLLPDLPPQVRAEAVADGLLAAIAPHNPHRRDSVVALAPYLTPAQLDTAFTCALDLVRDGGVLCAALLEDLAPYWSEPQLAAGLECADGLSGNARGIAMAKLVRCAGPDLRQQWLDPTLDAVLALHGESTRAGYLVELAAVLSDEQRKRVRAALDQLDSDGVRARALTGLIRQVPAEASDLIDATLALVAADDGVEDRAMTLVSLLPYLPDARRAEVVDDWLDLLMQAPAELTPFELASLASSLQRLEAYLPADRAGGAARLLFDHIDTLAESPRYWLTELAPHLPADRLDAALAALPRLADDHDRVAAIKVLAARLSPAQIEVAWAVADECWDALNAVEAMVALAAALPDELRVAAMARLLTYVRNHQAEYQAEPFVSIAPHLSDAQRIRAIAAAEQLSDPKDRAWALASLAGGRYGEPDVST